MAWGLYRRLFEGKYRNMNWVTGYQKWLTESESLSNAQIVANFFQHSDWTRESISALCGNMRHESSLNPDMYEYGYSWESDRGYGLVQWTPRSKYWNWATGLGLSPRDGGSQLARINYEVEQNIQWIVKSSNFNSLTFKEFRENARGLSVSQLTEAFTWGYERPNQTAGQNSMPARVAFAERCLNELDWTGTGTGGSKPALPVKEGTPISSPYGWRIHPISGDRKFHAGTDFDGDANDPIYATQSGIITLNQWSDSGGWMVYIQHTGDPYHSRYLHLSAKGSPTVGSTVTKGQHIGLMGTTGSSTGVHLHFEVGTSQAGLGTEAGTIDPEIYLQMTFGGDGGTGETEKKRAALYHLWLSGALSGGV